MSKTIFEKSDSNLFLFSPYELALSVKEAKERTLFYLLRWIAMYNTHCTIKCIYKFRTKI